MADQDEPIEVRDLDGDREEIEVEASRLIDKVKELAREGNARRLHIKNEEGRELIDIPLPVGAVGIAAGVLLAPTLAAVGAVAALVTRVRVEIERTDS